VRKNRLLRGTEEVVNGRKPGEEGFPVRLEHHHRGPAGGFVALDLLAVPPAGQPV
jgi:hypothetical protein